VAGKITGTPFARTAFYKLNVRFHLEKNSTFQTSIGNNSISLLMEIDRQLKQNEIYLKAWISPSPVTLKQGFIMLRKRRNEEELFYFFRTV